MLDYPSLDQLTEDAKRLQATSLADLFAQNPQRAAQCQITAAGLFLDYSKNLIDQATVESFKDLAQDIGLKDKITEQFNGQLINNTESRAALHSLLRTPLSDAPKNLKGHAQEIHQALNRVEQISADIRSGIHSGFDGKRIRQIVHIGIGGSYLGPHMVDEALSAQASADAVKVHYIANVDGAHIQQVLADIKQQETLLIVVSKTFTTLETMTNANTARQWLLNVVPEAELNKHLIAITTNQTAATAFGVSRRNIIPMWDWVGGRYSMWSGVSLPIAIRYGFQCFRALLDGARQMDQHFVEAQLENNMPIMLAMISFFYQQYFAAHSHAILPYDHGLRLLPEHLQQVDMESNGKSVTTDGSKVDFHTGAVLWGGEGSNGQHAFHQLLHQGTRFISTDFILPLKAQHDLNEHHERLAASCFSQAQALMLGRSETDVVDADSPLQRSHKVMPGNRPSSMILMAQVDPASVGALVAMYEQKIFCQAIIWQINPFDQWGVELGKALGESIYQSIQTGADSLDPSTDQLIARYRAANLQ